MNTITLDYETHWAKDYTLSKMSAKAYIDDPRFQVISATLMVDDGEVVGAHGPSDVAALMAEYRSLMEGGMVVAHNMTGFDAYILQYVYGIVPRMWGDTVAMARPIYGKVCNLSLASLVEHLKIGVKNNAVLLNTCGKRYEDFTAQELDDMMVYNKADTWQCRQLFKHLTSFFSAKELWHIDATVRMRTEPKFVLDTGLLKTTLASEKERQAEVLLDLARQMNWLVTPDTDPIELARANLASAPKFSHMLGMLGVEVPMKTSATTGKQIPALAKSDEAFLVLQEHPDPRVAAAAVARLDVKSTLLATRIEKFLDEADHHDGYLPVPLKYCGADTTGRDSGESFNPQNLPRVNPSNPRASDALRMSLRAPEGYVVGVADQSGIELRVNHFLWKVPESMALYQASPDKADLYKAFAATLTGKAPEQVSKDERQLGKVASLGLGYGSGWVTFQKVAKLMGGVELSDGDAQRTVDTFRSHYPEIVRGWRTCHSALDAVFSGERMQVDPRGLLHTCKEGIALPSGRLIRYPNLHQEDEKDDQGNPTGKTEWWYGYGRHRARIYAGKITENAVQALARDSVFDAAIDFYRLTGYRPALKVHDELVYVWPEADAPRLLDQLQGILRTPPKWWPELVVWSEGDIAQCYGDAK